MPHLHKTSEGSRVYTSGWILSKVLGIFSYFYLKAVSTSTFLSVQVHLLVLAKLYCVLVLVLAEMYCVLVLVLMEMYCVLVLIS